MQDKLKHQPLKSLIVENEKRSLNFFCDINNVNEAELLNAMVFFLGSDIEIRSEDELLSLISQTQAFAGLNFLI